MYGVPLVSYWFGVLSLVDILVILFFTYMILKRGFNTTLSEDDFIYTSY